MAYTKYSLTPANNTAAPPDGAPEGMLPSAVNDTMRDMMAQIRDCGDGIRDGTYTMTTPKITGGTITGAAFTGNTLTSPVISGGTINNTTIGATTATTGKFTTLEATGVATLSAGAVGTPALTTTGDTNTGIYFPSADTVAIACGGSETAKIIAGQISIPATSSSASSVRLFEDTDNGTNYVDLIAPSAITSNRTLTIPDEDGTILTTASSGQSIPKAALPTGSVLQVVSATYSTAVSITSASYTDTGLQASITPTSSSSKILILVNQAGGLRLNSTSEQSGYANLVRGATQITEIIQIQRMGATASQYAPYFNGIVYLDSPATTSSTTYKTQAKVAVTADTGVLYFQVNSLDSTITLMEIAA